MMDRLSARLRAPPDLVIFFLSSFSTAISP